MTDYLRSIRYTLDNVTWTAISPPASFYPDNVTIRNLDVSIVIKVRTTSGDSSTEQTLPPNQSMSFNVEGKRGKYQPGQVICYVQAASGAPELLATFQ